MAEDEVQAGSDNIVTEFSTYEDFLDSQITARDLFYLEDEELAREFVELGYRGSGEVLKREEFLMRKAAAEASRLPKRREKILSHANKVLDDPFLQALAEREDPNRIGRMNTIIFIRDKNSRGLEISGYIDYAHRLKNEDFEPVFLRKKRFLPRSSDLSFYNWETQSSNSNSTQNYHVISENTSGLLFKNKRDNKIVNVDPWANSPGYNSSRHVINSKLVTQAVFYDHVTARKT